jgi:hypothetical protein
MNLPVKNSFADDLQDSVGMSAAFQMSEQETGKVGVNALVVADQFVRERQARHKSALLQPEDARKSQSFGKLLENRSTRFSLKNAGNEVSTRKPKTCQIWNMIRLKNLARGGGPLQQNKVFMRGRSRTG